MKRLLLCGCVAQEGYWSGTSVNPRSCWPDTEVPICSVTRTRVLARDPLKCVTARGDARWKSSSLRTRDWRLRAV